jgi:radical SAM-linked protein
MILRLVYTKHAYMKFLGHLELMRFFERAFRRLNLPLKFSEGFNPHPKFTFGGPLSVGVASLYEVMEVELTTPINYELFIQNFNASAPYGLEIREYYLVPKTQSLMSALALSTYEVTLTKTAEQAPFDLERLFDESDALIIRKKNKKKRWEDKDLKPFIKSMSVLEKTQTTERYLFEIHNSPQGSAKPAQIIEVLTKGREEFDVDSIDILRTGLFYNDGNGFKPLAKLV